MFQEQQKVLLAVKAELQSAKYFNQENEKMRVKTKFAKTKFLSFNIFHVGYYKWSLYAFISVIYYFSLPARCGEKVKWPWTGSDRSQSKRSGDGFAILLKLLAQFSFIYVWFHKRIMLSFIWLQHSLANKDRELNELKVGINCAWKYFVCVILELLWYWQFNP